MTTARRAGFDRWARCVVALAFTVLVSAMGGCDGEGTLTVIAPPEQTRGPRISGQVRLPNGELARASTWHNLLAMVVQPVEALFSASVAPVGSGVIAELVYVDPQVAIDGDIPTDLPILDTASTNDNGQYEVFLPADTTADRCRYMVQVGNAGEGTLTRAFVFRSDGPVDIDFASEAVVRQILAALADGLADDLCDYEADDIEVLYQAALALPGTIGGDTVAAVNANANAAVSADAGFQMLLEEAGLPGPVPSTRTPTATVPALSTPTSTVSRTRTATATETPRATRTEALTPTQTSTPSVTNTVAPTSSPTRTAATPTPTQTTVSSATATQAVSPSATSTSVVPPTNTVAPPTATGSVPPTATVAPASSTPTASRTLTPIASSTPTQPAAAALNLGTVSGAPGMVVSVPVVLVGTAIAAVSTDIEFNAEVLEAVLVEGRPDCEAAPSLPLNKQVVTSLPSIPGLPADRKVVRVGVIGTDNNDPLPGGTLLSCRFLIDAGAPLGNLTLINTPEGSDALGNPIAIAGSDGTVIVGAAPPSLELDMVVGTIGESFTLSATLHSRGQIISALSTGIAVGTAMLDVLVGDDQIPDCIVDDAIGIGTTPDKRIFAALVPDEAAAEAGQAAGVSTELLRVGIIATDNNQPIPDGQVFHCQLGVPAQSNPGSAVLTHRPEGSSPDGTTVGLQGQPATITIVQP